MEQVIGMTNKMDMIHTGIATRRLRQQSVLHTTTISITAITAADTRHTGEPLQ